MTVYGKIFESIYDGTLVEDWRALITFQQMIILSSPDGIVDMTPRTIARRTGIPIEHIEAGLKILANPDPYSRTPGEEGRRITLIDDHREWGWHIVNHEKYKNFRTAQDRRTYMREYMKDYRKQKDLQKFTNDNSKQPLAQLANTDTDTYSDTDAEKTCAKPQAVCPYQQIVDLYHECLPNNPRVVKLTEKRKAHIKARWKHDLETLDQWRNYFEDVAESKFLTGRAQANGDRKPFIADMDFLTNESNLVKIAERKYHDVPR